eukprot:752300-Hanusia_phi.AAC.6
MSLPSMSLANPSHDDHKISLRSKKSTWLSRKDRGWNLKDRALGMHNGTSESWLSSVLSASQFLSLNVPLLPVARFSEQGRCCNRLPACTARRCPSLASDRSPASDVSEDRYVLAKYVENRVCVRKRAPASI